MFFKIKNPQFGIWEETMKNSKAILITLGGFLFAAFVGYPFESVLIYLILWIVGALGLEYLTNPENHKGK